MPLAMKTKDEILAKMGEGGWWASQFTNPANIAAHVKYTVKEILRDFPDGLDYVIGGVGTGGHMTACGEELKKVWPNVKIIAVQPAAAPVLTGGKMAPHRIQGIMAGATHTPSRSHTENLISKRIGNKVSCQKTSTARRWTISCPSATRKPW